MRETLIIEYIILFHFSRPFFRVLRYFFCGIHFLQIFNIFLYIYSLSEEFLIIGIVDFTIIFRSQISHEYLNRAASCNCKVTSQSICIYIYAYRFINVYNKLQMFLLVDKRNKIYKSFSRRVLLQNDNHRAFSFNM